MEEEPEIVKEMREEFADVLACTPEKVDTVLRSGIFNPKN